MRGSRFFTVAAGIGADAHLFYKLNPLVKGHLGMAAYYAKATRLWLTHPMEKFAVEIAPGFADRGLANCWRFASATLAACCASWRRGLRSTATIYGWCFFVPAAGWRI